METGVIFDIKGFALNDGPGIRTTVFLKGCPLRCLWCHNPEGMDPKPELRIKTASCLHCGKCREPCFHPDCKPFGRCLHICPRGCLSAAGAEITSADLAARLMRDRDVFGEDGGVTFSGGEPLMQARFVRETAGILKSGGVNLALETSSFAPPEEYRAAVEQTDLVLADLKLMDPEAHRTYCGVSNERILENLRWLMGSGREYRIRVPLIPGITDTEENLDAISAFVGDSPVELLPYNTMAGAKYPSVGREYGLPRLEKQSAERVEEMRKRFRRAVGGEIS